MNRRSPLASSFALVGALALGGAAACDRAPSAAGLKEWTPQDHDGEKKQAGPNQPTQAPRATGSAAGNGTAALAELAWQNQCLACHGPTGHGDGPQGAMVKAPDLSNEELQARSTDAQLAATITTGRGRMPKFDLPEEVVRGLVVRIRSFRGR